MVLKETPAPLTADIGCGHSPSEAVDHEPLFIDVLFGIRASNGARALGRSAISLSDARPSLVECMFKEVWHIGHRDNSL